MVVPSSGLVVPKVASAWPSKTSLLEASPNRHPLLPKVLSLTGQEDFGRLLSKRPSASQGPFSIHLVRVAADRPAEVRLGFILSKKMLKRAVWRNQVKRWSRELLRHHLVTHPVDQRMDVLVRARAKMNLNTAEALGLARQQLVVSFQQAFQPQPLA